MKPDHLNTARAKDHEYIENYFLPNFLIQDEGQRFIAFTQGDHMPDAVGFFQGRRSYYAYSNVKDLFINFIPKYSQASLPKVGTQIMSLSRYSDIKWILHDQSQLLYDGQNCMEAKDDIIDAILAGKNFRLSLQMEDGNWLVSDVDLPFYVKSDDHFQFQTSIHWYSQFFKDLHLIEKELEAKNFPTKENPKAKAFGFNLEAAAANTYLSVFSNGSYQDTDSLMKNTFSQYQRILLFAS